MVLIGFLFVSMVFYGFQPLVTLKLVPLSPCCITSVVGIQSFCSDRPPCHSGQNPWWPMVLVGNTYCYSKHLCLGPFSGSGGLIILIGLSTGAV
jgi:hypothetical protein